MPANRLTALDASFLAVESPTAHMHVGWAAVFEPATDGTAPSFDELRDHIALRLPRAPRYRQMIREVPLGLNSPVWIDDENFDIERHVVRAGSDELEAVVAECMSSPLPHDRALWQLCVADRLEDGRIGVVGKAHHCMVDGIAAVELASLLLDAEPDAPGPQPDRWQPRPAPDRAELVIGGLADFVRDQLDLATLPARVANSPRKAVGLAQRARRAARALASSARPASLASRINQPISRSRRLGLLSRRVDDLQRIKHGFDVKLNDVLLAAAAGGVRRFLRSRGEAAIPLKTMVPVSVRPAGETGALGNRISFMFVTLPCDEPDPVRRLRRVHAETRERKRAGEPEGADDLLQSVSYAPTPVQAAVSRIVASPRSFNLTVSNIPGPPEAMYMRGCRLAEAYPVVPIADRHALSIGMTTVGDDAFFGLYADPVTLPDVDELAAEIDAEVDALVELSADGRDAPHLVAAVPPGG